MKVRVIVIGIVALLAVSCGGGGANTSSGPGAAVDEDGATKAVAHSSGTNPAYNDTDLGGVWAGNNPDEENLFDVQRQYTDGAGAPFKKCMWGMGEALTVAIQDGQPPSKNHALTDTLFTRSQLRTIAQEFNYFTEFESDYADELPGPTEIMEEAQSLCQRLLPEGQGGVGVTNGLDDIESLGCTSERRIATIRGELTNSARTTRSYRIYAEFIDAAGTRVADGSETVRQLAAGQSVRFEVSTIMPGDFESGYRCQFYDIEVR